MWIKIKLFFNRPIAKRTVYSIVIFLIIAVLVVPTTFSFIAFNNDNIFAYTRDHSSGTFEAFDEEVLGNSDEDEPKKFSKNVMEVSSNDRMISDVRANDNTIGYVSLGTIGVFNTSGEFIKDPAYNDISILNYEGVFPDEDNIKNGITSSGEIGYTPSRNFNQFFRVEAETEEAKILEVQPYFVGDKKDDNYEYWTIENNENLIDIRGLTNEEKLSYAYYQWILHSPEAEKIIEDDGEISAGNKKWDKNETKEVGLELIEILYGDDILLKDFNGFDKKVKIEQVGSTSVQTIITDFEMLLSPKVNKYNVYFYHAQNGSGDASKIDPPAGSRTPYIGFQSREPQSDGETFEYSTWGYKNLTELIDSNAYNSFAIDAIAIIANNEGLTIKDEKAEEITINNITEEAINQIYYQGGYSWQELYDWQENKDGNCSLVI